MLSKYNPLDPEEDSEYDLHTQKSNKRSRSYQSKKMIERENRKQ